uniref:Uncharacterized protein n=1 Tax=Rhizophagus irregularis (strain DAOM 181602 / DAOM 197198 / MUCL 43194) TaxID=747089 RepID=U9TM88_RHIID
MVSVSSNRRINNTRRRRLIRRSRGLVNLINNDVTLRSMQQMPPQNTDNENAKILFGGCSFP